MAARLEERSISQNLLRTGLGVLGYCLCAAAPVLAAPDDTRTLAQQAVPVDASASSGPVAASVSPDSGSATAAPDPEAATATGVSAAPDAAATPDSQPVPESQVEVEAPIPTPAPEEAAPQQIVTPIQESLHYPVSQWPVMTGQSPLFGTEAIADFSEAEMMRSKWSLRPHVALATVYDDNIFITKSDKKSDLVTDASVGLTLRVGHPEAPVYLIADYTFGTEIFADHGSQNSIENSGYVNLLVNFKKLTLGFQLSVQSGSVTSIDVGDRVQQTNFTGGLNASYILGEELSITASLTEAFAYFDSGFIGNESTQLESFLNYQVRPKITLGLGGGFSYITVEGAAAQTSEDVSARVLYSITEKLAFSGQFGEEFRQFGDGAGDESQPIFGIGVSWAVRAGTDIELSAQRGIFASASLQSQDYIATGVSLGVTQRINDLLGADFAIGYQNQSYEAAARDVLANRDDDYYYFRPGLQIHVAKRVDLTLYYEYSENLSSGLGAAGFSRNRLGAQLGLLF